MDEDQVPSQIVPEKAPRLTIGDRLNIVKRTFFTRDGLLGTYDYGFLFRPNLPFMKKSDKAPPFFGLNDRMPVVLALLLGFQHALAMVCGILTSGFHCQLLIFCPCSWLVLSPLQFSLAVPRASTCPPR